MRNRKKGIPHEKGKQGETDERRRNCVGQKKAKRARRSRKRIEADERWSRRTRRKTKSPRSTRRTRSATTETRRKINDRHQRTVCIAQWEQHNLRCHRNRRIFIYYRWILDDQVPPQKEERQKNLKQYHEDVKNVTEKAVQDVVKTYNLASIEEGIPVNRVNQKDIEAACEATRDAREAREATREAREATREAREATREALEARKACESRVVKMLRGEDRVMIIRAEPV